MISWLRRLHLFGPIVWYDLVRSSRRRRFLAIRFTYGCFLLLALLVAYADWYELHSSARHVADFSASFFLFLMLVQYLCVLALTPAYTAGVIAEERERQTLDALLATELSTREIVFGYYVARLAKLGMVLLTGLPVVAILQFLGGIDPALVLAGFAACGLTLVSLAALSLLQSMLSRKPREAIVRTYIILFMYLAVTGLGRFLLTPTLGIANYPSTDSWTSPVTLTDALDWLGAGNLFVAGYKLMTALATRTAGVDVASKLLWAYTWFHGTLSLLCCTWVVLRLRAAAQLAPGREPTAARDNRLWATWLLGAWPMSWKELLLDTLHKPGWLLKLGQGLGVAVLFWPAIHICTCFGRVMPTQPGEPLGELLNCWVRVSFSVLGTFMLLQVAFRASGSIASERERQTLDSLLAAPLTNRSILAAKWLGSIGCPRLSALLLLVIGSWGIWTGTVHVLAVTGWCISWLVLASFLACLGMWFSGLVRSSRRATWGTMLTMLGLLFICWVASFITASDRLTWVEGYNLLPPFMLFVQPFSPQEWTDWWQNRAPFRLWIFPAIWTIWLVMTLVLWKLVQIRFQDFTGRIELGSDPEEATMPETSWTWSLPQPHWAAWGRSVLGTMPLLLPLAGLVTGYFLYERACDRDLRELIVQIEATDGPIDIDVLEAQRAHVPDAANASLLIQGITQKAPKWIWNWEHDPIHEEMKAERQLRPSKLALLQSNLRGETSTLVEARRLKNYPSGRRTILYKPDGQVSFSPDQHIRHLAALLDVDALLRIQQENYDQALESIRALLHTHRALGDEPLLASQWERTMLEGKVLPLVERCLAQGQATPKSLLGMQRAIEGPAAIELLLIGLRGQRALADRRFQSRQEGKTQLANTLFGGPTNPRQFGLPPALSSMDIPFFLSRSIKRQRYDLLRSYSEYIEAAKLPPGPRDVRFVAVDRKWSKHPLEHFLLPVQPAIQILQAFLRCQAEQDCTRLGLALERFRIANGRWPSSLAALVPEYVLSLPVDPFDGQPMRYVRWEHGVVVYSIGLDLTDNGGTVERATMWRWSNDIGMRLWDPAHRRQAPLPPKKPGPSEIGGRIEDWQD